jgi:hypothetical protein
VRARIDLNVNTQLIAADNSTRRMHEINVTGIPFGIERALDDERALVMALDETCATRVRADPFCWEKGAAPKSEAELGLPAGRDGITVRGSHVYTVRCW